MTEKIKVIDSIANKKSVLVRKICKDLFEKTAISYFCYLRRYQDGSFIFLPSIIDFGCLLFEDGYYPDSWFAGLPFDSLHSGYTFWDIAKQFNSGATDVLSEALKKSFKLIYGIEMIEKYASYCDFYSFSGSEPTVYVTPVHFLKNFIFYFKQNCNELLQEAYNSRLIIPNLTHYIADIPILSLGHEKSSSRDTFDIKRYYLDGNYAGVFITDRELEVLKQVENGLPVKCVAECLHISPRTVEHHITNMRKKLGVSRSIEIIHIAREQKLI